PGREQAPSCYASHKEHLPRRQPPQNAKTGLSGDPGHGGTEKKHGCRGFTQTNADIAPCSVLPILMLALAVAFCISGPICGDLHRLSSVSQCLRGGFEITRTPGDQLQRRKPGAAARPP